ncbi:MAG: hypothetical protein KIS67_11865 [Verrucomicrobiae bacterium]|nr:hypothetical protein [Verrucomicrobiae bacterium]
MEQKWKLVGVYPIKHYACGLVAGQMVRLLKDVVARDTVGQETGTVFRAGEIWEVVSGSDEPPIVVWLRRSDGERQTWDDTPSIYDYFEIVTGQSS